MNGHATILVADDEFPTRSGVQSTIREWSRERIDVCCAENGIEALELVRARHPDLIVADIRMPGMNGIELLERLRKDGLDTPLILLTGYAEFEYARQAVHLGACDYLLKPVEQEQLIASIEEGLARIERIRRLNRAEQIAESGGAAESFADMPRTRNTFIREALAFIHREYANPSLGIKRLAAHIHLNPSYVSVLFKEETGEKFSDYLLRLRLAKAKEMLLQTDLKIYEIAERAGFSASKYFVKAFRLKERMTPRQYRNRHSGNGGFGGELAGKAAADAAGKE